MPRRTRRSRLNDDTQGLSNENEHALDGSNNTDYTIERVQANPRGELSDTLCQANLNVRSRPKTYLLVSRIQFHQYNPSFVP